MESSQKQSALGRVVAQLEARIEALGGRLNTAEGASAARADEIVARIAEIIAVQIAPPLGQMRDAAARIEQDTGQRYEIAQGTMAALAERLDRIEALSAGQSGRSDEIGGGIGRIEALLQSDAFGALRDTLAEAAGQIQDQRAASQKAMRDIVRRLDRVDPVLQRLEAIAGENRDSAARLEAQDLAVVAGVIRDTAARIEADAAARHGAVETFLVSLIDRLDRIEGGQSRRLDGVDAVLSRIEGVAGVNRDAVARLEALDLATLAAGARDAASRLEADAAARHQALEAILAAFAGRFDRVEGLAGGNRDAAARLEVDAASRHEASQSVLKALIDRLDQFEGGQSLRLDGVETVLQRIEGVAGLNRDAVARLEALDLGAVAGSARDAAARLEKDSSARHKALDAFLKALIDRLDRAESGQSQRLDGVEVVLQRIEGTAGINRDAVARLEALDLGAIAGGARDAATRLEKDAAARHKAVEAFMKALTDRLDRVEGGQSQRLDGVDLVLQRIEGLAAGGRDAAERLEAAGLVSMVAAARDAASRLESDSGARYSAIEATVKGLFERLDRMEVGQSQRAGGIESQLQRIETTASADHDAIARIEADAGRRFEALMASRADMVTMLRRMERLVARGGAAPAATVPDRGTEWIDLDVTARSTAKTRPLRAIVSEAGLLPWAEMGPIRIRNDLDAPSPLAAANAALADFLADRVKITADERLLWIVPATADEEISNDEAEQIFGLLGRPETIVRAKAAGRGMLLVAGSRRREEILPVLRWSMRAVDLAASGGLPPDVVTDDLRSVLVPVLDLPGPGKGGDPKAWAKKAALVMGQFEMGAARVYGVTVPLAALDRPESLDPWLAALRAALGKGAPGPVLQWVRDPIPVARSGEVIALAGRLGTSLDLTATTRDMSGAAFAAYDDRSAYHPMRFDLRLPSPVAGGLVCVARRDTATGSLHDPFAGPAQRLATRLRRVLRRDVTHRFAQAVAAEPSLAAGQWEHHHIYNWRPVPDHVVQAEVFDAELDLADVASTLAQAETVRDLFGAAVVAPQALAARGAPPVDRQANIDLQVEAHRYLSDQRPEPSADSLRLASWFPDSLGETLEIGSGYGVLAEQFVGRTSRYVGIDLTLEQGMAIGSLGGLPLIGDIHALPLADARFDTVIADNVVEHATDPVAALAEMRRVLKPGGRGFLVLPLDYLGPDYRNLSHHWKADVDSILTAMAAAGLEVLRHEVCIMPAIGAKGSFPSCNQRTSLWEVRRPGEVDGYGEAAASAGPEHAVPAVPEPAGQRSLTLDFRAETRAIDPVLAGLAEQASEEILALNARSRLDGLARRSPALKGFDWSGYIRLSELRFVRAAAHLARRGASGRVLDLGSYFGNLSLLLRRSGWSVTAVDAYAEYRPALDRHAAVLAREGVELKDFAEVGLDLSGLEPARFDAVLCMGVIEHVPHTPRLLLAAIDRVLKPGGWLVMDTPNLAYDYQRARLARGESVFPPLAQQFDTDIPFEGHHREYTPAEMRWMMERIGYGEVEIDLFSYSIYGLPVLTGEDLARFEAMLADPERRELIMAIARKPAGMRARRGRERLPRGPALA